MRISDWSSDVCSSDLAKYPDVPLVSEIDPALANFAEHAMVWTAIVAPAKTPAPLRQRLEAELKQVVADPAFVQQVHNLGDTVRWRSAQDTREQVSQEITMWPDLANQANLTVHKGKPTGENGREPSRKK